MRVFKKRPDAKNWTIELRDHRKIVRRFVGLADRRQTEQLGNRIVALIGCRAAKIPPDAETAAWLEHAPTALKDRLAAVGIIDPTRVSAAKPLVDLLTDYRRHLEAKNDAPKTVNATVAMLTRMFRQCRFTTFGDIRPGPVEAFLHQLRAGGLGARTSNAYLIAVKGFCRWMVDTSQASFNPIRSLKKVNEKPDLRRQRRAATPDELRRLLTAAAQGPERFGLTGPERALLYRLCVETGLRANEVRNLTAGDIDLAAQTVTIQAAYSKHRQTDVLPLRDAIIEALRGHLAGKLPATRVFGGPGGRLTSRTALMLQMDLEDAGIAGETKEGIFDFHALRHTFITGLNHAPSRVAQRLARHKSSAMTDRYTHVRLHDERSALELLPDLTESAAESVRRTGTDNGAVDAVSRQAIPPRDIDNCGARRGALSHTNDSNTSEDLAKANHIDDVENAVFASPCGAQTSVWQSSNRRQHLKKQA